MKSNEMKLTGKEKTQKQQQKTPETLCYQTLRLAILVYSLWK